MTYQIEIKSSAQKELAKLQGIKFLSNSVACGMFNQEWIGTWL